MFSTIRLNLLVRIGIVAAVLLYAALHGVSYLRVVSAKHPYEEATHWIFEHVPPGSKILGVHWDDKLPLRLPGLDPEAYRYKYEGPDADLAIYEPDSPQKLERMATQLSRSDYVIFPTQRIPGSIPRVPFEQPLSTALLQLLFDEQLGYRLVASFKHQPGIGPIIFNTDLADESISVYDHPKVTIFANEHHLPAAEIRRRIEHSDQFGSLPTREQMLARTADRSLEGLSGIEQLVRWYVVLVVLTLVSFPFVLNALPGKPALAWLIAKPLGVFAFAYCFWLLELSHVFTGSSASLWFLAIVCGGVGAAMLLRGRHRLGREFVRTILFAEATFAAGFSFYLALRIFQPEIFWGEKPMDFTFLNFFIRSPALPPQDPWSAGNTMHYYYFGFYLFALLHRMTGVSPGVGFNLAGATVGAALVAGLYALFVQFSKRHWIALLSTAAVALLSNLEWLHLLLGGVRSQINFDFFWATSRLFTTPAISEYPLWSHLFADLHPHLMAQPLLLAALTLFFGALLEPGLSRAAIYRWALFSVAWGGLILINTWDFISVGALVGVALVVRAVHLINQYSLRNAWKPAFLNGMLACSAAAVALGLAYPFLSSSGGTESLHYGFVEANEFNNIFQLAMHLGGWLVAALLAAAFFLRRSLRIGATAIIGALCFGLVPPLFGLISTLNRIHELPWPNLLVASLITSTGFLVAVARDRSTRLQCAGILLVASGVLMAGCELYFLMDRMNTMFKFYNSIWIFVGSAAVLLVSEFYDCAESGTMPFTWRFGVGVPVTLLGCLMLVGTVFNLFAMLTFQRIEGPRPTLDGTAYFERKSPSDAALANWIARTIRGTPTTLEAQGPSYQDFSRISMHTGLPTVLGWEYHVQQRGTPPEEVQRRMRQIREIYSTLDAVRAESLICDYKVRLIVVGDLERATYRAEGLAKFAQNPERFPVLYSTGNATVYGTRCAAEL